MSLNSIQVKVAKAYARLAIHKGIAITYSQKGETGVTIYGFYGSQSFQESDAVGLQEDSTSVAFTIPYQTGCTAAPPVDSTLEVSGDKTFSVLGSSQLGFGASPVGWRVDCKQADPLVNKIY